MRKVQVVYDFVCPWSFAVHELARTRWRRMAQFEWVPWEAYPDTPTPGATRAPEWRLLEPRAQALFDELKLPFKPSKLLPNERLALRAALWCDARGQGEDFRDGVFRRLYERGLDNHLTNPEVLAGLVERTGLDPMEFLADMKQGALEAELDACGALAEELGVRWVPTFVVGKSLLVGDLQLAVLDAALRGATDS